MRPVHGYLSYVIAQLRKRISGRPVFGDFGQPELEHPARELSCRPALYEPDQLSRITGGGNGMTFDTLMTLWTQTRWTEAPLHIFRLGPACILRGTVITRKAMHWMDVPRPMLNDLLVDVPSTPESVVLNSQQGLRFFGHWLGDDCSSYEAFPDHPGLISMKRPKWGDVAFYEKAFDQHWQDQNVIVSENLILLNSLGFSRRKGDRYRTLRHRLRKAIGPTGEPGKIVYIRRGPSAKMRTWIANDDDVATALEARGITVVTPEGDTAAFVRTILDAAIVITMEGSQARHSIYGLCDGGGLLILQPPDQAYGAAQEWMRVLDLHCGMVIGMPADEGFTVNPDEVLSMTDRLLAQMSVSRQH